jgi:monoamine oxidase
VGAGLSGMVAAYELVQAGHDVVVLEARTRAGGRVLTLRTPFADGMYAEAGAMSFPDNADQVMKYVRLFDLPIQTYEDLRVAQPSLAFIKGRCIKLESGENVQWPVQLTPEEEKLQLDGMQKKYLGPPYGAIGNPATPGWPPKELAPIDQMSILQYAESRGASPGAIELFRTMNLSTLDGDGPAHLSALVMLRSHELLKGTNEIYVIRDGNDRLPQAFADRLMHRIRYGSAVFKIEQIEGGVRAWYTQGTTTRSVDADYLICAIPFTVLRSLEVSPPFSPTKQAVINGLPSTSVTRIFWQFSRRFWEKEHVLGLAQTDLPIMTVISSYQRPGLRGVLEAYTAGPTARELGTMAEEELLCYSLKELSKVYPEAPEHYEGGTVLNWDKDPWARGAYAWYEPGQLTKFSPDLTRPEGAIHFAGDQTSDLPGWMQGALLAGQRAANEVMQSS